jgi:hypothetical protein
MTRASFPSDTIALKAISTGGNSAGNGGDGYSSGGISNSPHITFDPYNKADGGSVHVSTGDQVHQTADWEAGGANANAQAFAQAHGATAMSNGSQSSYSGHDTSNVDASTTASQLNFLAADMNQSAAAGIGGNGGSDTAALGGNVNFEPTIESANLNDVLNHDFAHV